MDLRCLMQFPPAEQSRKKRAEADALTLAAEALLGTEPVLMLMLIEARLAIQRRERLRIQRLHRCPLAHHALVQTQNLLRVSVDHAEIVRDQQQRRAALHLDTM